MSAYENIDSYFKDPQSTASNGGGGRSVQPSQDSTGFYFLIMSSRSEFRFSELHENYSFVGIVKAMIPIRDMLKWNRNKMVLETG